MKHGFHAEVVARGLDHPFVGSKTAQTVNAVNLLCEILTVKIVFQLEFDDLTEGIS